MVCRGISHCGTRNCSAFKFNTASDVELQVELQSQLATRSESSDSDSKAQSTLTHRRRMVRGRPGINFLPAVPGSATGIIPLATQLEVGQD